MTFYLYNLEFPLPKYNLYQIWMKLACWFWRRFLKMTVKLIRCQFWCTRCAFRLIKSRQWWFSLLWPLLTPKGPWFVQTWFYIFFVKKLSCRYELFWLCDSREKKSMTSQLFSTLAIISPLLYGWTYQVYIPDINVTELFHQDFVFA
jgi:hypothetical protein